MDTAEVVESELVRNDLIYIEPTSSSMRAYKKLIKDQSEKVCQNQMTSHTILSNIERFSFGFIHISTKATVGARRVLRQSLNGMVCCRHKQKENEMVIAIVCSRKHSRLGKKLMQAVEDIAYDMGVAAISLHSLAEEKLKRWYESLGFNVMSDFYLPYGDLKSYYMKKMLTK